jgi:hypothetical protein
MSGKQKTIVVILAIVYCIVYFVHDLGVFHSNRDFFFSPPQRVFPAKGSVQNHLQEEPSHRFGKSAKNDHFCPFCSGFTAHEGAASLQLPFEVTEKPAIIETSTVRSLEVFFSLSRAPPGTHLAAKTLLVTRGAPKDHCTAAKRTA